MRSMYVGDLDDASQKGHFRCMRMNNVEVRFPPPPQFTLSSIKHRSTQTPLRIASSGTSIVTSQLIQELTHEGGERKIAVMCLSPPNSPLYITNVRGGRGHRELALNLSAIRMPLV